MSLILNGITGVSGVDGTAGTPALQGNDSNTGVSFGTDTVTINTGGVARVTTDASGNVGIGTTTPTFKLDVSGIFRVTGESRFDNAINLKTATLNQVYFDDAIAFSRNGVGERMRIDSSGNLLVGTASGAQKLTLASTAAGEFAVSVKCANTGGGIVYLNTSGTTSYNAAVFTTNGGGTQVGSISAGATATTYATSSDYRLKENVAPMTDALATVAALKPCTYTWEFNGRAGQGFIAHELQEVVPDCVTGTKDAVDAEGKPQYQGVDTSFLVATLVKAIQELTARLEVLENK